MTATTTKTKEMEATLIRAARLRNRVIPDGIDLHQFAPIDQTVARTQLGWPQNARIALFAGRADAPEKRLWFAEEAISVAQNDLPHLELKVVSGVSHDKMPIYYSAADCLLHTSASEGSPNVIKEALACDLPIIATPAGDIERLVEGAQPGAVVQPDINTVAQMIVECCREPVRSNGRSVAAEFGLAQAATATVDLYHSVAQIGLTKNTCIG
jgi:glycosyltransferase involved in cell wall biosynthesis